MNVWLTLSCLLLAGAAAAQSSQKQKTPPTQASGYSETIEVTATRIPEDIDDVPVSIQVLTAKELRDRGATDLESALALAAGVEIAPGGDNGPRSSVPALWGLKELDAYLLVVDGVPWGGAFNPAVGTLDLDDVERIEVHRGPAPVMYGATSFVGVIHVVRRSPGDKQSRVTAGGGSYEGGSVFATTALPAWAGFDSFLSGSFDRKGFRDPRTSFKNSHLLWRNRRLASESVFHFDVEASFLRQRPASPTPRTGRTCETSSASTATWNGIPPRPGGSKPVCGSIGRRKNAKRERRVPRHLVKTRTSARSFAPPVDSG